MKKIPISLSIALIALIVWGIHNYDVNSNCYEITDIGPPLNAAIMIDKCKGRTWALVNDESESYDFDEDGNKQHTKFKTLVWTRMYKSGGTISLGDIEE